MLFRFAPFALSFVASMSAAQDMPTADPKPLSLEDRSALRCSAAFALVAHDQAQGDAKALTYPALSTRGREFLVRTSARIMDDTGQTRDAVAATLRSEAQDLRDKAETDQIMSACLLMLELSGL